MTKPVLRVPGAEVAVLWPTSPKLKGATTISKEEMVKALEDLRRPKNSHRG